MKKLFFYAMAGLLMLGSATVMTSCGDDDDPVVTPEEQQSAAEKVAGTYKGTLEISLAGVSLTPTPLNKNVAITKASDDAINMELKDFSFMGFQLGDIVVNDCKVVKSDNGYSFTGTQTLDFTAQGIGNCGLDVNGNVVGEDMTINLDINVQDGLLKGQQVKVVYKGTKLTGNESSEAKILTFTFDAANEANSIVTEQPIINEDNTITFKVDENATNDQLKALVPTVTYSEKATGTADGTDFSQDVKYTVVAENGDVTVYTVKAPTRTSVLKYDFEEWKNVAGNIISNAYDTPMPDTELATSAPGAAMLKMFQVTGVPVYKETSDVKSGTAAAKLVTMDISDKTNALVPSMAAGSLFTGTFDSGAAFPDPLMCTLFGIDYAKKPLYFKGWYKYTPGTKYIDGEGAKKPEDVKVVEGTTDECAIQAVLYVDSIGTDGKSVTLNGHDINTSGRRVAVAKLADGTAKADWTEFNIAFNWLNGQTYDKSKKYKIAIVCSSSKDGDRFKGAGDSTLLIDDLEVVGE